MTALDAPSLRATAAPTAPGGDPLLADSGAASPAVDLGAGSPATDLGAASLQFDPGTPLVTAPRVASLLADAAAHAGVARIGNAVILATAAVLIGLTARDVLDGPDAAPRPAGSTGLADRREWFSPARLVGLVPVAATLALSLLVWTTPMRVWLWGVAVVFGGTLALAPLVHGRRLALRAPTAAEARRLGAAGVDDGSVRVVETASRTHRNGYSIGGPLSATVGVSRAAVATLPPAQLAAVVAHERGHHAGRHALVRSAASAAWLLAGAAVVTTAFSATTPAASVAVFAWLAGERVVAVAVARATEYRADAHAARRTSPDAVAALLRTLRDGGRESTAGRLRGAVSAHPGYERRIERVESHSER